MLQGVGKRLQRASSDATSFSSAAYRRKVLTTSTSQDDSGNSSSSSSVISSLEHLRPGDIKSESASTVSLSTDSCFAQSSDQTSRPRPTSELFPDDLYHSGYELANYFDNSGFLVPLHRTVCCALCRKQRQRKAQILQQESNWESFNSNDNNCDDSLSLAAESCDSFVASSGRSSPSDISSTSTDAISSASEQHGWRDELYGRKKTDRTGKGSASGLCNGTGPNTKRSRSLKVSETNNHRHSADPAVMATLGSNNHLQISPKDEKLMALLTAKRKQQQQHELQRHLTHQLWEKEAASKQRRQNVATSVRHNKDRRSLHEVRDTTTRQRPQSLVEDHQSQHGALQKTTSEQVCRRHIDSSCTCNRDHNRKSAQWAQMESDSLSSRPCTCTHKPGHEDDHSECCPRFVAHFSVQKDKTELKPDKHLVQALERRANVESRLEAQRKKMEKYMKELTDKQEQAEERISALRLEKQLQVAEVLLNK